MKKVSRRIIITGSSGLIGKSLSTFFYDKGFEVLGLDISNGDDLSDESFVKDWFEENKAPHLINLFAINDNISLDRENQTFLDIDLESFRNCLDVNITSLLSVCREYARNNNKGNIVNFSSIYGLVSPRNDMYDSGEKYIGYGVSKAAVIQLTKHLAVHLSPNMRVNCVIPGGIFDNQPDSFMKLYSKNVPMKRMMHVEEIHGIVEFLISDQASYCTGGLYSVDGGWTSW